MPQVQEFNSIDELVRLRPSWDRLLEQTAGATYFQTLDWLQTYWPYFGAGRELRVLVVEDGGRSVGILPLVITTESYRVGPVRVLTYPLHGWGSFYGPIGQDPLRTLTAGLKHIATTARDWDILDLRWVDDASDKGQTSQAMHSAGFAHQAAVWHSSALVDIDRGWEHYWGSRTSRWRNNVRRCERILAEHGRVEHVRYRPRGATQGETNPRWDLYDACVDVARRSWQGKSTTGTTLSHDSIRDYLRAAHVTAVRAGAVDVNLLLLDGRPVAFAYNYCHGASVYGLRSGYDAAAVEDGAGTVLLYRSIEDSCRRGDRLIDLGPDYLDCKRHWLTRLAPARHYTHFRPTRIRAQAVRLKRTLAHWIGGQSRQEFQEEFQAATGRLGSLVVRD